ncbi:pentatricopeptide repeat-containing protein [Tanacetum coccineum]
MITSLSQNGNIEKAREYFDEMPERNVISWNSMLAGYVQHGFWEEGLNVLMRLQGVKPDWINFVSSIGACANAAILKLGHQIVSQVEKFGFGSDVSVKNSIVTMYSKCGRIREAEKTFDLIVTKNLISWNAMMAGYAQSGQGLVSEGHHYFDMMIKHHDISPTCEHFACMVDLLGRSGHIEKAKELIDKMPMEPNAAVWGALLGACRIHGNSIMAETALKNLVELDAEDSGSYVLLANLYSDSGNLENVSNVRKLMKDKGIRKNPGCSVGWKKIEETGMYAVKNGAMYHSEKLALAFGLMSLPAWMPVNIMKNLRICDDCHMFMKMASRVTSRELIVRDANQ